MAMLTARRLALAIAVLTAAPAFAASASLLPASYSARWKVVVIPYRGAVPTYTMHTLTNPPRVYLDLEARAFFAPRTHEVAGHPALLRFAMAPRGEGKARVTLTFKTPTRVRVVHNAKRKLLLLVPESVQAPQAAGSPQLGLPRYDASREAVIVPLTGPMPAFKQATLADPPRVYIDFQAPGPKGVFRGETEEARVRWVMAGRGPGTTRLTLTFDRQTPVQVKHDAERQEIVLAPTFPAPAPGAPTPPPAATPSPEREASPASPAEPIEEAPAATP